MSVCSEKTRCIDRVSAVIYVIVRLSTMLALFKNYDRSISKCLPDSLKSPRYTRISTRDPKYLQRMRYQVDASYIERPDVGIKRLSNA